MNAIRSVRVAGRLLAYRINTTASRTIATTAARSEIHEIKDYGFAPKYKGEIVRGNST